MEIAKLSKSTFNNQLRQAINLCDKRNMSQRWQVNTLWQNQGFKGQGHYSKVKVKLRSHYDVTHLHHLTNVPTKYQPSTPYSIKSNVNPQINK